MSLCTTGVRRMPIPQLAILFAIITISRSQYALGVLANTTPCINACT